MAKVEIRLGELADAICKNELSRYAVVGKLMPEDNPNEFGVQVSFGNKPENQDIMRFVFVTERDFMVDFILDARAWILKPHAATRALHEGIQSLIIDKYHEEEKKVILAPTEIERPDLLGDAMAKAGQIIH